MLNITDIAYRICFYCKNYLSNKNCNIKVTVIFMKHIRKGCNISQNVWGNNGQWSIIYSDRFYPILYFDIKLYCLYYV